MSLYMDSNRNIFKMAQLLNNSYARLNLREWSNIAILQDANIKLNIRISNNPKVISCIIKYKDIVSKGPYVKGALIFKYNGKMYIRTYYSSVFDLNKEQFVGLWNDIDEKIEFNVDINKVEDMLFEG